MSARPVTVRVIVDTRDAFRRLARAGVMAEQMFTTPEGFGARLYVRGAFDPAYATEEARDRYVQLLAATAGPDAAARFLAGWVAHRQQQPAGPLAWHRLIGATRVQVGGAVA